MKIHLLRGAVAAAAIGLVSSCTTVSYYGPSNYVGFSSDDKVKLSEERASFGKSPDVTNTYDDAYVYDVAGNVVKRKVTEYFDYDSKDAKFIVWETEYKQVGGQLLPWRQSVNGVVYVEVEYSLLQAQNKGRIPLGISERVFTQEVNNNNLLSPHVAYNTWSINTDEYPVDFRRDDRFVVEQARYSSNQGRTLRNVLTMGNDNIVLTRFLYSYEKLTQGIKESYTGYNSRMSQMVKLAKDSDVEFNCKWDVIGGKICLTQLDYSAKVYTSNVAFSAAAKYNEAGQRVEETWTVQDDTNADKGKEPRVIFQQKLSY